MALPPVAILAGGRGTRLGELTRETPKPLLEVAGEPFLFHQLRLLRRHGAERVVLCVGYLGARIEAAVGPRRFGLEVAYSYDDRPGTAAALRKALPSLGEEFLVLYGDTYLPIDYGDVATCFRGSALPALMTVLPWQPGNAEYADGRVVRYEKAASDPALRWLDYGLEAFTAGAIAGSSADSLEALLEQLAAGGELAGYLASKPFHEIGTPASLRETERFLQQDVGTTG